jgi:hypothetical protein
MTKKKKGDFELISDKEVGDSLLGSQGFKKFHGNNILFMKD